MSSINGTVTLAAPSVNKTKTFVISATKPGYIDYSIFITIYPALSPENLVGFFIVIGICIIIIVTTIVIMFMKYLRRKRINKIAHPVYHINDNSNSKKQGFVNN